MSFCNILEIICGVGLLDLALALTHKFADPRSAMHFTIQFNSAMLSQSNVQQENFSFFVFIFGQLVFLGVAGRLLCFSPVRNCFRLGDKILQTERDMSESFSLLLSL